MINFIVEYCIVGAFVMSFFAILTDALNPFSEVNPMSYIVAIPMWPLFILLVLYKLSART